MDVDGVFVVDQDVIFDGGVFHGIESVIIPGQHIFQACPEPSRPADLSPLESLGKYNTFIAALKQTGLASRLGEYDAFIVAPTDEALAAANIGDLSEDELKEVLQNHLITSSYYNVYSYDLIDRECVEATTLGGLRVAFRYDQNTGSFSVNGIPINSDMDIEGNFGLAHGVNGVLTVDEGEYTSCLDFTVVTENGKYNAFLGVLEQTKVTEMIADTSPVTIFGPADTAMAAIQDTVSSLSPEELQTVVANHVVLYDEISSEQLMVEGCIDRTMEGGMRVDIRYDNETATATVNGIPIVEFDIRGNFGVLHGISAVLIEGQTQYTPCVDFTPVVNAGKYGSFLTALNDTSEIEAVTYLRPVVLFAPTDEAFADLDPSISVFDIIQNHVVYDSYGVGISSGCIDTQTAGGMNIDVRYDSATGKGTVNGVPIVEVNITGNFGVLHGLSGVLIEGLTPYTPCIDISPIVESGNYSTFLTVLNDTKQNEFISIRSPVTFFGPTDSAFALIQDRLATLTDEEVVAILDNHIIAYPSNVTVEYVKAEGCVDLFSYGNLEISIRYNETTGMMNVNGIPVVDADVTGNFGVMHGIEGVLGVDGEYFRCAFDDDDFFSPGGLSFDILDELATEFQRPLFTAVLAAGESSATIFGPDDSAFRAIEQPGTEEEVLEILKGHVVAGRITSDLIKAQKCMILDTLAGTKIRALFVADEGGGRRLAGHTGGTIMINDAKVIATMEADGALIHGIDKVILPGSFEECATEAPIPVPTVTPATISASFAARLSFVFGCMIVLVAL